MQIRPRYRVVTGRYFAVNWYLPGQEFDLHEWPKAEGGMENCGAIEAVNEQAERVLAYRARYAGNAGFPSRLLGYDGLIYLPGALEGSRRNPAPAEKNPTENMPRYKLRWRTPLGGATHEAGETVAFLGWPGRYGLIPANDQAEKVAAYERQYVEHPDLLPSPWCAYRNDIFLPSLRALKDNVAPRPEPAQNPKSHPARAPKSLRRVG